MCVGEVVIGPKSKPVDSLTANHGSDLKEIGETETFNDEKFWNYCIGLESQKQIDLVLNSAHGAETLRISTQG